MAVSSFLEKIVPLIQYFGRRVPVKRLRKKFRPSQPTRSDEKGRQDHGNGDSGVFASGDADPEMSGQIV